MWTKDRGLAARRFRTRARRRPASNFPFSSAVNKIPKNAIIQFVRQNLACRHTSSKPQALDTHPRWLHDVDQAAARQIDCCNAFAAGETRRGRIGFAFSCDCGRGAGRVLSDLASDVGIAVSSSEVAFQVAKRVLDGFTSVWKSTSELGYRRWPGAPEI